MCRGSSHCELQLILKLSDVFILVHTIALHLQHLCLFAPQLMPQQQNLLLVLHLHHLHLLAMLQRQTLRGEFQLPPQTIFLLFLLLFSCFFDCFFLFTGTQFLHLLCKVEGNVDFEYVERC